MKELMCFKKKKKNFYPQYVWEEFKDVNSGIIIRSVSYIGHSHGSLWYMSLSLDKKMFEMI